MRAGADFAVVGGVAVSLNGFVRATDDVHILVEESLADIRKLLDCLCAWGEGWARELKVEDFVPQEGSIRIMEDFDLDIFTRMRDKSLEFFRPRLRYLQTSVAPIPFLSPADLIFLRQGSIREKDQLDVAALRRILESPQQ